MPRRGVAPRELLAEAGFGAMLAAATAFQSACRSFQQLVWLSGFFFPAQLAARVTCLFRPRAHLNDPNAVCASPNKLAAEVIIECHRSANGSRTAWPLFGSDQMSIRDSGPSLEAKSHLRAGTGTCSWILARPSHSCTRSKPRGQIQAAAPWLLRARRCAAL